MAKKKRKAKRSTTRRRRPRKRAKKRVQKLSAANLELARSLGLLRRRGGR